MSTSRSWVVSLAFAAIRDWEVITAYRDVDLSAYVRVRRLGL
jgi:hypothetical protein